MDVSVPCFLLFNSLHTHVTEAKSQDLEKKRAQCWSRFKALILATASNPLVFLFYDHFNTCKRLHVSRSIFHESPMSPGKSKDFFFKPLFNQVGDNLTNNRKSLVSLDTNALFSSYN